MPHIHRPVEVLLVEDSPADVFLTRRALAESSWDTHLFVVGDGAAALAALRVPTGRRADLVLLDVNLPGLSGHEVLALIRDDHELTGIPVVMFTSSTHRRDVIASYRGHANCHVAKPADLHSFGQAVQGIEDFWLAIVELPDR